MQNLQIDKKNARKLFPSASPEFKQMLIDTFGEKFFAQKAIDRILTFEDACEEVGAEPGDSVFHQGAPDVNAYNMLTRAIIPALNPKGWKPDFSNSNQRKWYPYFQFVPGSGFRFDASGCGSDYSAVGSRLVFADEETSNYAGRQFQAIYNQLFN